METLLLSPTDENIHLATKLLNNGEVVGMPTETVYGLAADALNENAVAKIFTAKGRPQDNPLIVHISDLEMLKPLVSHIPSLALKLAEKFWPGPLTMVMPKSDLIPSVTSGGLDTVGIRMPSHSLARRLISESKKPLAAPSANLSGSPSPTTAQHVFDDMNGRIPAIIDGGASCVGVESTVVSFENNAVRVLRPGFISVEDLLDVTQNVLVDKGVLEQLSADTVVKSPGMKYKHYAPKAEVYIVDASLDDFKDYVCKHNSEKTCVVDFNGECSDLDILTVNFGKNGEEQAQRLFDILRELDKNGIKTAYFRCPDKSGVGLAVYNRLLRASAFRVIKL